MDGQTLQGIFESPNFSLWNPASEAFNLAQQKAQQGLQAAQGQEQRAQAMQPLEQQHKAAVTGYNQALTNQLVDKQAGQLPAADRMKQAMAEYRQKMNESQSAEEDAKMQRRMQYAEMASKNNGVLPLEYMNSLPEDERSFYANPQATQRTQALAKAWYDTHPKTLSAKAKQDADYKKAIDAARIMAESRVQSASAGKGGSGILKTIDSKLIALQDDLGNAKTPEEAQYIKDQIEYFQSYAAKKARDQALARQAGNPDLAGRIPTLSGEPSPNIAPPERGGAPKSTPKPLTYKTPDDVKAAFKSGKLTKEQAIQLLQKEHGMQ